jgi:DNA polymerase I-like protein with 3'-5' exonuclease and polymerase domains
MLIKIDAAQLEWRTAVWLSNDKVGIDELNSGADIHSLNEKAFNLPSRLIAKIYLFRTIYRGNGWSFANDPAFSHVSSSADFWDKVNEKFYKKYKDLDAWHTRLANLVTTGKPIVSPFGREWLIPMRPNGDIPWTTLTNYPVQGTGADLMTVARISLHNRMRSFGLKSLMVSTVHDDIKVDAPDNEIEQVAGIALKVFDDIPVNVKKLFNVDLPIRFPGEVSVGKDLLNMEKYG